MNSLLSYRCLQLLALSFIGLGLLAAALPALAQEPIVPDECRFQSITASPSGCTICHLGVMAIRLTTFLMTYVAVPAGALLVAAGGFVILTAGPSEERLKLGKKMLTATIIGLIIIALAWLGVDTIIKVLTGSFNFGGEPGSLFKNLGSNFGPWNGIPVGQCGIK
ncbi:MAG: hypothetical protein HY474_00975 [Candidatus Sungbacteria bacterium]|uniref:Uncharacterized protein n=1 Tax=Candidatus Sungiibacteriota bacterium TaxID=2750080 RepID=A0A932YVM8_9BACT|nr:hypothetical protein [Candidatus Sungbacteria bacterium]